MGSKPAEQWNIQYEYITKIGNYYEWITEANREIHSNSFKLGIKKWIPEILWMNYRGQQEMKASNRYFSKTVNKIDWKRWMFCMSMLIYIHSVNESVHTQCVSKYTVNTHFKGVCWIYSECVASCHQIFWDILRVLKDM